MNPVVGSTVIEIGEELPDRSLNMINNRWCAQAKLLDQPTGWQTMHPLAGTAFEIIEGGGQNVPPLPRIAQGDSLLLKDRFRRLLRKVDLSLQIGRVGRSDYERHIRIVQSTQQIRAVNADRGLDEGQLPKLIWKGALIDRPLQGSI
jgi:hypothetical protein